MTRKKRLTAGERKVRAISNESIAARDKPEIEAKNVDRRAILQGKGIYMGAL